MASVLVVAAAASCILLAASVSSSASVPVVYSVGDERRWTMPLGNGTETYNHWARKNRFQVSDVLDFKYANDSVLLVSHDDYKMWSTESPASRFTDGDTRFKFDRVGLFYFISCVPGHCEAGQRMIVRVMGHSALAAAPATAPASLGGASSPVISDPDTPSYGSSSGSSSSSSPSPLAQPSGASRRALTTGFSIVIGLLGAIVTMLALA